MKVTDKMKAYWRSTQLLTYILLAVWFVSTYIMIPLAPSLNHITFLGFPLGFYMAAQGTLIIYVLIIIIYAFVMNKLDKKYGVEEEDKK